MANEQRRAATGRGARRRPRLRTAIAWAARRLHERFFFKRWTRAGLKLRVYGRWTSAQGEAEAGGSPPHVTPTLENALDLIAAHDPVLARRLPHLFHGGLWVRPHLEVLGQFNIARRACELSDTLFSPPYGVADVALSLVHEAAHARIEAAGIGYGPDPERRARIERVCVRRERAFARRSEAAGGASFTAAPLADFDGRLAAIQAALYTDAAFQRRAEAARRATILSLARRVRTLRREGLDPMVATALFSIMRRLTGKPRRRGAAR
ncbi:MAG: hypothetical protein AAF909_11825 [Pseudomonadota bacterium]